MHQSEGPSKQYRAPMQDSEASASRAPSLVNTQRSLQSGAAFHHPVQRTPTPVVVYEDVTKLRAVREEFKENYRLLHDMREDILALMNYKGIDIEYVEMFCLLI